MRMHEIILSLELREKTYHSTLEWLQDITESAP